MTNPPAAVTRLRLVAVARLEPTTILLGMLVGVLGLVLGCGGGAGSDA
jgi:hypothetical protein